MINPFYILTLPDGNMAVMKLGGLSPSEALAAVSKLNSSDAFQENHHYVRGVRDMADELKSICKDYSDRQNRPYMGDVYSTVDSLRDRMIDSAPGIPLPTPAELQSEEEPESIAAEILKTTTEVFNLLS